MAVVDVLPLSRRRAWHVHIGNALCDGPQRWGKFAHVILWCFYQSVRLLQWQARLWSKLWPSLMSWSLGCCSSAPLSCVHLNISLQITFAGGICLDASKLPTSQMWGELPYPYVAASCLLDNTSCWSTRFNVFYAFCICEVEVVAWLLACSASSSLVSFFCKPPIIIFYNFQWRMSRFKNWWRAQRSVINIVSCRIPWTNRFLNV